MEKINLEKLLKENTMNLYSSEWYSSISDKIINLFNEDKKIGYVYFLRSEKSSYIKIGKSKDIDKRVKMLEYNVGKINILGFIYNEDYDLIEKQLHAHFKDKRMHGEWFDLSVDDIKIVIEKNRGQLLNTDVSKVIITEGVFEIKSINTNLQEEIFIQECNNLIVLDKKYLNSDLQEMFSKFNFSQKKITLMLKYWSTINGLFYKQINSNGKRCIYFIK